MFTLKGRRLFRPFQFIPLYFPTVPVKLNKRWRVTSDQLFTSNFTNCIWDVLLKRS
jgi:hypothetical protein